MRNMRSSLPVFIFIGLALLVCIGVIVLEFAATSAVAEVNLTANDTAKEELSSGVYSVETIVLYGVSALLFLVACYFALKSLI